jgi:hypothetical protein
MCRVGLLLIHIVQVVVAAASTVPLMLTMWAPLPSVTGSDT